MTTVAYVDAQAGIAGDMCLGALVDLGLDVARLEEVVVALGLEDVTVTARSVMCGPLSATKVDVLVGGHVPEDTAHLADGHGHASLGSILGRIRDAGDLPAEARADAVRVFEALADAEAKVHGSTPEEVHFHEVGAADALVDIVGTCVGLRALGATEVRFGPMPFSTGTIVTAHGKLPLPPPAVLHLMEGLSTFPGEDGREQVTPTGAALARALSRGSRVPAGFVVRRVGTGAGTHDGGGLPNVVRIVLGEDESGGAPADAVLLEANLDDVTGQEVARAIDRALVEGALDAWVVPVTMKKGRPGHVLSVLAPAGDEVRFQRILFAETPTLGVRRHAVQRATLARRFEPVSTPWGDVRMKVRSLPGGDAATPEHDDARRLADRHGLPLREVLDAARLAWAKQRQAED